MFPTLCERADYCVYLTLNELCVLIMHESRGARQVHNKQSNQVCTIIQFIKVNSSLAHVRRVLNIPCVLTQISHKQV